MTDDRPRVLRVIEQAQAVVDAYNAYADTPTLAGSIEELERALGELRTGA